MLRPCGGRISPTAGDDAFVAGLTGIVPRKRVCLPPCDASSAKPRAVETQMSEAPTAATASELSCVRFGASLSVEVLAAAAPYKAATATPTPNPITAPSH